MNDPRVEQLDFAAFEKIAADWDELLRASDAALPFLTHPWLVVWWRHFGRGLAFECVTVRRDGRLLAAVPLAIRERRLAGLRFRTAEIVGTGPVPTRGMGLADRADLVVRRGEEAARATLCGALAGQLDRVDLVHLAAIPDESSTVAALARSGLAVMSVERSRSPYLPLDGGWEEYLRSRSQRFRKQLKRSRRGLEERGALSLERLVGRDAGGAVLEELAEVDRLSWKGQRGTGLLQHPAIAAFARELIPELAARGSLELHVLRVGGQVAAYEMAFDLGGRVFAYNAGYRRDLAAHAPGNVVTAEVIRSACERGRSEYDMLRGDEPYKLRWSGRLRRELELLIPAPRAAARLATVAGPYARARLRRVGWLVELGDRASGLYAKLGRGVR